MPGALGDFRGAGGGAQLTADPFFVHGAEGRLRGDFLGEEAVGRGGRNTSGRGMRLVKKTGFFEVDHDVADGCAAQALLETLGDGARRYRLARLDVGTE